MVKRTFLLGDEWLYYKIYCGVRTADLLLEDFIAEISSTLIEKKLIDSWFFIRYGDPDPHLRVRFKLLDITQVGQVISLFNELARPYVEENLIWSLKTDSYVRELERYGSNTIEQSEAIFFYESEFIVNVISLIKDDELYFLCIVKAIDDFINLFEITDTEKLQFYKKNAAAYKKEFNIGRSTKLSLDKKYRASIEKFSKIMSPETVHLFDENILATLHQRKVQIKPLIESVLEHGAQNTLEVDLNEVMTSHIHMFVNRAFRGRQRFYEMVGYDFLLRLQNSKLKRGKKITK